MAYLKQFGIILTVSFAGEILGQLIPLPIPASIYGLVIMLACLCLGLIRLEAVREAAVFLIDIMPLMFIPAAVGLMESWAILKPCLAAYVIITLVVTVVVIGVSALVTQALIRRREDRS